MRLTSALCTLAMISAMGCATAPIVEYRRPPPPVVDATANCDPNYPCPTSYYWDEWREVYVYYDGYKYIDCTGMPGATRCRRRASSIAGTAARLRKPPTAWVPGRGGTYHAPVGVVARGGPAPPLPQPVRDAYGNPNNAGLVGRMPQAWTNLPAPPSLPPAYPYPYAGQPPAQGYQGQPPVGYVGPQNPNRYGEPNRPGEVVPPPQQPRGDIVEPPRDGRPSAYGPPPRQEPGRYAEPTEPARGGYGAPPPPVGGARAYESERRPTETERPAMAAPVEQRERMEPQASPEQPVQQKKPVAPPPQQHNAANPGTREPTARDPATRLIVRGALVATERGTSEPLGGEARQQVASERTSP